MKPDLNTIWVVEIVLFWNSVNCLLTLTATKRSCLNLLEKFYGFGVFYVLFEWNQTGNIVWCDCKIKKSSFGNVNNFRKKSFFGLKKKFIFFLFKEFAFNFLLFSLPSSENPNTLIKHTLITINNSKVLHFFHIQILSKVQKKS